MSSDTQVKQEDRTRALGISLGVACVCGIAHKGSVCDKHQRIIDLLATVRREAFKEARRKVYMISGSTNVDPAVRKGFAAGVNAAIEVITALESTASNKSANNET